jgi:hypothetical protein
MILKMSCKTFHISLFLLFNSLIIVSQSNDIFTELEEKKYYEGDITIIQDETLKEMVTDHVKSMSRTIPGYRINIFRDSGTNARQDAENYRSKFIRKYGNISSYLIYDTPFFKVYIGDFRTKSEALKVKEKIKWDFPDAFIINDDINPPDL